MKKALIKIGVCIAVFISATIIISTIMNRGNTDLTAEMKPATFPLVYMEVNNQYINCLHGYASAMEGNYLRDSITPLQEKRSLPIKIKTFGPTIKGLSYEIRSMDMQRLVEDTTVTDYTQEDAKGYVSATLYLKDLIEPETEYLLVLKLNVGTSQEIRYYTRIINPGELYLTEKMDFVNEFHEKTFDKEQAKDLVQNMETNAEGDNSSFGYVNIHSNFEQLTWGDLNPRVVTDTDLKIKEMDSEYATMVMTYRVAVKEDLFDVQEFYRIRRGSERIYLLEFERTMNQLFDPDQTILVKDQLLLGIADEEPQLSESTDGGILCFVKDHALYSYNNSTGYLAKLFAFWDKDHDDARTYYNEHDIKILSIDEAGNVRFMVYGYMNRGQHEGEVGAAIYHYDTVLNSIEEEIYIPCTKSYELLKQDVNCLSYVNKRSLLYMMMDGTIYEINLLSGTYQEVVTGLTENRFVVSNDNSVVAWQTGDSIYTSDTILLMNLNGTVPVEVKADTGDTIVPLGFMDEDFIYGIAKRSDIARDSMGRTVFPMYTVRIEDKEQNILKEYEHNNIYVTNIKITDNVINLERLQKDSETGNYTIIANDQIMNNLIETTGKNVLKKVVTSERETTLQVTLTKESSYKMSKLLTPKQVLYEGNHNVGLEKSENVNARYYVYAHGGIAGVYTDETDAVNEAVRLSGVVVDDQCAYVWAYGSRASKMEIEGITAEQVSEGRSSLAICLDELLRSAGAYKETSELLASGKNAMEILKENTDAHILELTGCSLDSVLYYVNRGFPVMATIGNEESVLLVGYDEKNTILFNPTEGTIAKMGMNDSDDLFTQYGNKYITFIK